MHAVLISAICLQRFGLAPSKGTAIFISLPVTIAGLSWLLITNRARVSVPTLMGYLAFLLAVTVSAVLSLSNKDPQVLSISLLAPVAIILNYTGLLLRPNFKFDRSCVFPIFVKYTRVSAVLGIVQYLAQFAGVRLFSLYLSFPALRPVLVEQNYNFDPISEYGSSIRRANGLFNIEPAIFSQLIVTAVCVEFFVLKRIRFLPVYAIAYILSYSGTGALSLLLAMPFYIILFPKESYRLSRLALIGVAVLGIGALLFPGEFTKLTSRSAEFSESGSSGYHRYVGQFEVVNSILDNPRAIIGFGPGSFERSTFSRQGTAGPVAKLITDYGVVGLLVFFSTLISAIWRRDLAIIPLLMLSIFLFGGGNFAFSPFLMQMFLLCIWAAPPGYSREPSRSGLVGSYHWRARGVELQRR